MRRARHALALLLALLLLAAARRAARGEALSPDTAPLYLRESDAKVPGPRKRASA